MLNAPHRGSARVVALRRRLGQEREAVNNLRAANKADQARIDAIEIVLPEGTEFSEDATHADKVREIIKGNVKGARLKVEGKVTGRAKVSDFIADLQDSILLRLEDISDHFRVINDIRPKLKALGVRA